MKIFRQSRDCIKGIHGEVWNECRITANSCRTWCHNQMAFTSIEFYPRSNLSMIKMNKQRFNMRNKYRSIVQQNLCYENVKFIVHNLYLFKKQQQKNWNNFLFCAMPVTILLYGSYCVLLFTVFVQKFFCLCCFHFLCHSLLFALFLCMSMRYSDWASIFPWMWHLTIPNAECAHWHQSTQFSILSRHVFK